MRALAEEPCWRCGSWGHWAQDCTRYLTPEEIGRRWKLYVAKVANSQSGPA